MSDDSERHTRENVQIENTGGIDQTEIEGSLGVVALTGRIRDESYFVPPGRDGRAWQRYRLAQRRRRQLDALDDDQRVTDI